MFQEAQLVQFCKITISCNQLGIATFAWLLRTQCYAFFQKRPTY